MQLSTLIPAALAALMLTGFAATANAMPTRDDGYVTRAVRSPSGKDYFVRLVKVPKAQAIADNRDGPMMKDCAAMKAMCAQMADCRRPATPKG